MIFWKANQVLLFTSLGASSASSASLVYSSAGNQATHRGCHKFIPRHKDEIFIEIGDPIYVECESDDLWCEGREISSVESSIENMILDTRQSVLCRIPTHQKNLQKCETASSIGQFTWNFDVLML